MLTGVFSPRVQVASLRPEAKALTQKLTDADKLVKQLQSKVSASDRSILLLTKVGRFRKCYRFEMYSVFKYWETMNLLVNKD